MFNLHLKIIHSIKNPPDLRIYLWRNLVIDLLKQKSEDNTGRRKKF